MAPADIYPTRWLSPTVRLTVLTVQHRLQALLTANGIDRRVKVEARVITNHYGGHGRPVTAYLPLETNWADVDQDVQFRYMLDGEYVGSSTHEYEMRLDYRYPVEERPLWFDEPQAHGVSDEQLATIQRIPDGWCNDVPDDAEPFIVAAFGITVSVIAGHALGIVEIWDKNSAPIDIYTNRSDLETIWIRSQISASDPAELDPRVRAERTRRD